MKLDIQPIISVAGRLVLEGHLDRDTFERRSSTLATLEGAHATKLEHVAAYEESRKKLKLDGTPLAWERWRTEQQLLTLARAEVQRVESVLRMELELLEREVALAQHRRARAVASGKEGLA